MCGCGGNSVNGTPNAYSWDGVHFSTYQPNPPKLGDDYTVLYDEPGRCGRNKCDSHSYHFQLVKHRHESGRLQIACRHGGGTVLHHVRTYSNLPDLLSKLSSDDRYWLLHDIWYACDEAEKAAKKDTAYEWRVAAAEKRIKVRRRKGGVLVTIEPKVVAQVA
jgi:hypothetical protein